MALCCGYCGRELQSVALLYPHAKPCCGRGDCTIRALDEHHTAVEKGKAA